MDEYLKRKIDTSCASLQEALGKTASQHADEFEGDWRPDPYACKMGAVHAFANLLLADLEDAGLYTSAE